MYKLVAENTRGGGQPFMNISKAQAKAMARADIESLRLKSDNYYPLDKIGFGERGEIAIEGGDRRKPWYAVLKRRAPNTHTFSTASIWYQVI